MKIVFMFLLRFLKKHKHKKKLKATALEAKVCFPSETVKDVSYEKALSAIPSALTATTQAIPEASQSEEQHRSTSVVSVSPSQNCLSCSTRGPFASLPYELICLIFSFLPTPSHELCNLSAVCWEWHNLIKEHPLLSERRSIHWREVNWMHGRYTLRNTISLKTHPIWQLHHNDLITDTAFHYSGMDGTVQLLDLKSGDVMKTFTLPSQVRDTEFLVKLDKVSKRITISFLPQNFPVLAVSSELERLVISTKKANEDFAIEEYNYETGQLQQSIRSHTGWITCLQFVDERRVISGSQGIFKFI